MKRFATRGSVDPLYRALGAAAAYHHVHFQPLGDDGGLAPAVVLNVPEGLDSFDYTPCRRHGSARRGFRSYATPANKPPTWQLEPKTALVQTRRIS
ncbi:MAG TPA: hypothetical protein VIG52_04615 [Methyloceanibacter sp.]|jgi:hypothetical protein